MAPVCVHQWTYHILNNRLREWWTCKHCGWQVHLEPSPVMETVNHVMVEKQVLLGLVIANINHLNGELVEDEDGDIITCCYECCHPCSSIKKLLDDGELDQLLREEGPNWVWWDVENKRVSRAYLRNGWLMTNRHPECGTPEEAENGTHGSF